MTRVNLFPLASVLLYLNCRACESLRHIAKLVPWFNVAEKAMHLPVKSYIQNARRLSMPTERRKHHVH